MVTSAPGRRSRASRPASVLRLTAFPRRIRPPPVRCRVRRRERCVAVAGDGRWPIMRDVPEVGGRVTFTRDVTEAEQRAQALRESRARLDALVASLRAGAMVEDAEGTVILANDLLLAGFGILATPPPWWAGHATRLLRSWPVCCWTPPPCLLPRASPPASIGTWSASYARGPGSMWRSCRSARMGRTSAGCGYSTTPQPAGAPCSSASTCWNWSSRRAATPSCRPSGCRPTTGCATNSSPVSRTSCAPPSRPLPALRSSCCPMIPR